MIERLIFDARSMGELSIPLGATVLQPEFPGDVITRRIQGKGYIGGHNTANREGWRTSYPVPPKGAIAVWDDSEEGTWTGYDPAMMCVFPFDAVEVAAGFVADLHTHTGWYSSTDHVTGFAARLVACITNGVQFTLKQQTEIRNARFSIIGSGTQSSALAWQAALEKVQK